MGKHSKKDDAQAAVEAFNQSMAQSVGRNADKRKDAPRTEAMDPVRTPKPRK